MSSSEDETGIKLIIIIIIIIIIWVIVLPNLEVTCQLHTSDDIIFVSLDV